MRLLLSALLLLAAPAAAQLDRYGPYPVPEVGNPADLPAEPVRYGETPEQRVDLTLPPGAGPHPLVVWMAGADFARGADTVSTAWIPELLFDNGFALAEVRTRKDHEVGAAGVAQDNARAVAKLIADHREHGIDPNRVLLMGVGAQGHFAALLATDPALLQSAGAPFEAVRGVVVFNAEGFDVPARIAESRFRAHYYRRYFGGDPDGQRALSPSAHAAAPNAPAFLFVADAEKGPFAAQADRMARALAAAGADARVWRVAPAFRQSEETHLGLPQHPRTADLLAFLRSAAGMAGD